MGFKKFLYFVYSFLARARTNILTAMLYFIGLLCFALMPVLLPRFGEFSQDILFSLAFVCWGMTGILFIVRQEVDFGFLVFRGPVAIILGVVVIALSLWLALIPYFTNNYHGIVV
jgi:uncharacterized membrane protein HdeD (DUF308 family)